MIEEWYSRTLTILQWPPLDVYAVLIVVSLAQFVPLLYRGGFFRVVIVLPLLFFLPGYALLTVVFPYSNSEKTTGLNRRQNITLLERAALSFGMSVAITSLIAVALTQVTPGLPVEAAINSVSAVVVVFALLGAGRRSTLPARERFTLPVSQWVDGTHETLDRVPKLEAVLSVVLVVAAAATVGTLGFIVTQPMDGTTYTEFRTVQETDAGELVAANYTTQLADGEEMSLVFTVRNAEGRAVEYTVVVVFEELTADGTVGRRTPLDRFDRRVDPGETWRNSHTLTPPNPAENTRIAYYLYTSEPPANPTADSAYRYLYLWVEDVDPSNPPNGTSDAGP
jgi:uncharacterized membrane protein